MRVLWLLLVLCFVPAAGAQSVARNPHAQVTLLAETAHPTPGHPLTLGIRIAPQPGWHSYWHNPGEAGAENRLAWTLPPGATAAAAPRYPTPSALPVQGIMNHVYEGPATLLVDVAVPASAQGAFRVALRLDYLVCSADLCVPERAQLALPLTTGDGAADPASAPAFAAARAALPVPLAGARFTATAGHFTIAAPVPGDATTAHFFADADGIQTYSAPQSVRRADGLLILETAAPAGKAPARISGVLRVETRDGVRGYAIDAQPGAIPAVATAAADDAALALPAALGLALAGGLLLNVMPCVFPILSLKALALARGNTAPAEARSEARAYTAGVILTTTGLGAVILALRAGGAAAGWAFQLQDPRVILGLFLLMIAIALNLAGLFEIELGLGGAGDRLARKSGPGGAFWTGALAAFVATPCSGPFMAAALGAALVLPPVEGLAIFAGLGLGLALPFLALGYIPALRRALPKPGLWMARLRHILSIPMFATALGLAWVLGRQAGVAGMTIALAAALVLGLALWWLGARQRNVVPAWPPLGLGLAAAVAAVLLVVPSAPATPGQTTADEGPLHAHPWSEAALADARARHRPTLVYFTADWCITCKVNERGALADDGVARAFTHAGVLTLVGDWTRSDPAITRFLEARGRSGVPLYLFYHPDGHVEALPQILTPARLRALV